MDNNMNKKRNKNLGNSQSYRQLKNVSEAALLEEASHLKLIFKGVIVVALLIFAVIIWSGFVNINETTSSYGQLIPEGEIQTIQHLEGGIIQKLYVNDGDEVKKGQLLLQFDTTQSEAELDELRSREAFLTLDSERLDAFVNAKPVLLEHWDGKTVSSKYNPIKYKQQIALLSDDQQRLLNSQYQKIYDQEAALKSLIAQREEKLHELQEQAEIWQKHMSLLTEEFEMYEKLKKNNYVSYKDYLTVLRAVNQAKGDGARITSEIEQTIQAITESRSQLKQVVSNEREEALEKLAETNATLLQVRHQIEKLDDRIKRATVSSTLNGTVKGLNISASNVLKSGGDLMEIVPEGEKLIVESRVLPKEIGNLRVGDAVNVKVLTYDYARYGAIQGQLQSLSASTFMDKDSQPYYKAKISLAKQYVGNHHRQMLKAGMTVQADIVTGDKTLLQYLLKPIHRSITSAFRER